MRNKNKFTQWTLKQTYLSKTRTEFDLEKKIVLMSIIGASYFLQILSVGKIRMKFFLRKRNKAKEKSTYFKYELLYHEWGKARVSPLPPDSSPSSGPFSRTPVRFLHAFRARRAAREELVWAKKQKHEEPRRDQRRRRR